MNTEINTTHKTETAGISRAKATTFLRITGTAALAGILIGAQMTGAFAIDTTPEAIPGSEGVLRIIKWCVWGAAAILLMFFIFGLVQAGRSKNGHGEDRVQAPLWPAVMGGILTGVGTIWTALTGL